MLYLRPSEFAVSEDSGIEPSGGFFSHFVLVYVTWGPVTWGWPYSASLYACNLILVCVSQHRWLIHSLTITGDTHNRDNVSHGLNLRSTWVYCTLTVISASGTVATFALKEEALTTRLDNIHYARHTMYVFCTNGRTYWLFLFNVGMVWEKKSNLRCCGPPISKKPF